MTCRELIDFIDEYLEGELPEAVRSEFERHLSVCRNCRDYLKTYGDTISLSRAAFCDGDAVPDEVPEDLVKAILSARRARPCG